MKRVMNFILVLSLLAAMAVPALARNVDFVPSISDKGAPTIIGPSVIVGTTGSSIGTADSAVFVITPVSEVKTSDKISEEDKANLEEAYEKLTSGEKAYTICPELEQLATKLYDDVKEEDLVVRDLFDVSSTDEETEKKVSEGNTIQMTFSANVAKGEKVLAMVKVVAKDATTNKPVEKWVPATNVKNNGDGTVTVTLPALGAVVLMTAQGNTASSDTGDATNVAVWGAVVVLSLGAIVTMVSLKRRKIAE